MEDEKKTPNAAQRQRELTEAAINKIEKIKIRMTREHVTATVSPGKIDWANVGSAAHVNDLLDQVMEFMGIK